MRCICCFWRCRTSHTVRARWSQWTEYKCAVPSIACWIWFYLCKSAFPHTTANSHPLVANIRKACFNKMSQKSIISPRSHAAQIKCANWVSFVYIGIVLYRCSIVLFIYCEARWMKMGKMNLTKNENNKQNVRIQSGNSMKQCQKRKHM